MADAAIDRNLPAVPRMMVRAIINSDIEDLVALNGRVSVAFPFLPDDGTSVYPRIVLVLAGGTGHRLAATDFVQVQLWAYSRESAAAAFALAESARVPLHLQRLTWGSYGAAGYAVCVPENTAPPEVGWNQDSRCWYAVASYTVGAIT